MSDLLCAPHRPAWQVGISERQNLCRPGGASPQQYLPAFGKLKTRRHGGREAGISERRKLCRPGGASLCGVACHV